VHASTSAPASKETAAIRKRNGRPLTCGQHCKLLDLLLLLGLLLLLLCGVHGSDCGQHTDCEKEDELHLHFHELRKKLKQFKIDKTIFYLSSHREWTYILVHLL
jgi:hypothetical protein